MASPSPSDGRPVDAATADDLNARFWDALADRHSRGTGRFYDTEALARAAAAIAAGLVVDHLEEHLETDRSPVGDPTTEPDGRYRLWYGPDQPPLPVLFTLVAHRP